MTIAKDAVDSGNHNSTDADLTWTHTPSGTPRAVVVYVVMSGDFTDRNAVVTYGTETMTEMALSPVLKATGEPAAVYGFFLGTGIPTGAQTVTVSYDSVFSHKLGVSVSYTADADCEMVDTSTISSDGTTNPSVTVSLGGETCAVSMGLFSGQGDPTGITPLTDWTDDVEYDFTPSTAGTYTYDTLGTSDVTAGWTNSLTEDAVAIAAAFKESASGPSIPILSYHYNQMRK